MRRPLDGLAALGAPARLEQAFGLLDRLLGVLEVRLQLRDPLSGRRQLLGDGLTVGHDGRPLDLGSRQLLAERLYLPVQLLEVRAALGEALSLGFDVRLEFVGLLAGRFGLLAERLGPLAGRLGGALVLLGLEAVLLDVVP